MMKTEKGGRGKTETQFSKLSDLLKKEREKNSWKCGKQGILLYNAVGPTSRPAIVTTVEGLWMASRYAAGKASTGQGRQDGELSVRSIPSSSQGDVRPMGEPSLSPMPGKSFGVRNRGRVNITGGNLRAPCEQPRSLLES